MDVLRAYAPTLLLAVSALLIFSCAGSYHPAGHVACGSSYSHPYPQPVN